MSNRAIVLGITGDHAFAAGALLASIIAHDKGFDATVVIFHDGLSPAQMAAFLNLWPRCQFRLFSLADMAERIGVEADAAGLMRPVARYSPLVLAKLGLPALLAEFERVVWLDADMLVRGSLEPIWDFDCLTWRPLPQAAHARRADVFARLADVRRDPAVPLLNGGVLGLGRGFLSKGGGAQVLHDMARNLIQHGKTAQIDELSWYLTAASQSLPVKVLPLEFNHPVTAAGVEEATVIHAIGRHKFWNATPLQQLFPDWPRHHSFWVASGGDAYTGPVELAEVHPAGVHEVLLVADARAYWRGIFPELRAALPKGMVPDLGHEGATLRIFLHGRPDTQHLGLVRLPKPHRIGLELHLPTDEANAAYDLVTQNVPGIRAERGRLLSLPIAELGTALATVAMAIDQE